MKKFFRDCCKKVMFTCFFVYASIAIPILFYIEHRYGRLRYLDNREYAVWKNAFIRLLRENYQSNYGFKQRQIFQSFLKADIRVIRKSVSCRPQDPIVVLCVKNDRRRIEMLVNHYRRLGVRRFAFLDNGSTDGTFEWMVGQPDIDLYQTTDQYTSFVKEGWINRIVSYYGFERWYVLTDSDELAVYTGMEEHPLPDVVDYAEKHGYTRIEALTLDMYSDGVLFEEDNCDASIQEKYCWMDYHSYLDEPLRVGHESIRRLTGGPRMRVMNVSASLMKFPLVYFTAGTVSANAHFQYPYDVINKAPCNLAILHYKFLAEDKEEYERRMKPLSGFGFRGGYYKKYMNAELTGSNTFMYEDSIKFETSDTLLHIPYIQPIPFEEKKA